MRGPLEGAASEVFPACDTHPLQRKRVSQVGIEMRSEEGRDLESP